MDRERRPRRERRRRSRAATPPRAATEIASGDPAASGDGDRQRRPRRERRRRPRAATGNRERRPRPRPPPQGRHTSGSLPMSRRTPSSPPRLGKSPSTASQSSMSWSFLERSSAKRWKPERGRGVAPAPAGGLAHEQVADRIQQAAHRGDEAALHPVARAAPAGLHGLARLRVQRVDHAQHVAVGRVEEHGEVADGPVEVRGLRVGGDGPDVADLVDALGDARELRVVRELLETELRVAGLQRHVLVARRRALALLDDRPDRGQRARQVVDDDRLAAAVLVPVGLVVLQLGPRIAPELRPVRAPEALGDRLVELEIVL